VISSRKTISPDAVALHYDELDHFYRDVWGDHVHHGLWLRGDEAREEPSCDSSSASRRR
jgi:tocopherol O-methyltransferase